ncbi:MAG: hemolysin activation protein [Clostridia bacterium]|nr:hemolysin activation protein [Clostridia bacterium]
MYSSKIDIPVLILFFNRPLQLKLVFEQVKIARPSKLYLFQDGAREGRQDDIENVKKCREIVEDIDWECEVHRNYQEKNNGCDPSEYLAQKWMFATEEYGIVLEDDDVPSQSFFPYCKELLEKYKDDQRINMICGMNNLGDYSDKCPYDYFFSTTGSIWGWASWKRVIDEWSDYSPFVDNEYGVELFTNLYKNKMDTKGYINLCRERNKSGIAYYESIMSTYAKTQGRINIVPTKNMISNMGFMGESTHGPSSLDILPKSTRKLFNMKTYEIDFPIKHPPYVMEDVRYVNSLYNPSKFKRKTKVFFAKMEYLFRKSMHKLFKGKK